jgi:outer membrane protein assembly factor BamB
LSQIEGGPPVLAPTGLVLANANSGRTMYRHLFVVALSTATGAQRWAVHTLPWSPLHGNVPNSKGLAPLVTASGQLYMPFAGPEHVNAGIEVFSPTGQPLRRLLANVVPAAVAVARDGSVYELGGQRLVALTARGTTRWTLPIAASSFYGALLVGRQGVIYAGDGTALVACTSHGRVLWRRRLSGGVAALAERADGVVLAVGATGMSAVDPAGRPLWQRALGRTSASPAFPPSIAVDARGRAYVGTADGMVRAIAPDGMVLWTLPAGARTTLGETPSVALGPDGALTIAGTDGRLRVYR